MKMAYLILSLIGSATFGSGMAYAVTPGQASQQSSVEGTGSPNGPSQETEHVASDERRTPHATVSTRPQNRLNRFDKNPGLNSGVLTTTHGFNRFHNNRENSITAGRAARASGAQNGNISAPVRKSPSLVLPMVPAPYVRHRAPNPAMVNGSVNSAHRSTGAINGTRMDRVLRSQSR